MSGGRDPVGTAPVWRPAAARPPFWRDVHKQAIGLQVLFLIAVGVALWLAARGLEASMVRQNIRLDWGFFSRPAGFEVSALTTTINLKSMSLTRYGPDSTYAEAIIAGSFNTVKVAILGIVLALIIGLLVGVARLSKNWLVNRLALAYVEMLRNTPLLVQLFFWYFAFFLQLPNGTAGHPAIKLFGNLVVLTNRSLAIGGMVSTIFDRETVTGGFQMTSEFAALVLGLAVYTSAFIAEITRGGILALSRGQMEAARSLGLSYPQALRYVILPQALRIVIPPLGSQFLNLTKNSSLAIGIGYADMLTAANTVSSQSFRALETFTVVTLAYLAMSLAISGFLNLVRARLALGGA